MNAYSPSYSRGIKKDLGNIDQQYHKRILDAVMELCEDPIGKSDKVKDKNLPERKIRVGDYRVLFDVDHESKIVQVQAIKNRRDAYIK